MVLSSPSADVEKSVGNARPVAHLQKQADGVGQIVHVEHLAAGRARSPQGDRGSAGPACLASWNLRMRAGSRWLVSRSKLSPGP